MNEAEPVDLLVVGGGINGAGIARDAAGRGLKVVLCEQADLANYTSSASSKLIHGGLRYLEQREFRLARRALVEREILLRAAPHIIRPLRFILPQTPEQRSAWTIRSGLFLYNHLGGRKKLPRVRRIDLRHNPVGVPLKDGFRTAFAYPDCWVEDARLVVLNALDAHERGAEILTRTRCTAARRAGGLWYAELTPTLGGPARVVRARALINATGPWVSRFLAERADVAKSGRVRLVKGSHIIVPRLYHHGVAYTLQHRDRRLLFVLPYEGRYSLIGTTDVDYQGDPGEARISHPEIVYLCDAVSRYFREPLSPDRVLWTFAGVRPLCDDEINVSAVTREYAFDLDQAAGEAPLLSIFGGEITTYRRLAEQALEKLLPTLGAVAPPWTAKVPLPGGALPDGDFEAFVQDLHQGTPWLPSDLTRRYARAYGSRVAKLLAGARALADLGERLGDGLYEAEVEYLRRHEWAVTAEDILWRRSRLGLHVGADTVARLEAWLGHDAAEPRDALVD